MAVLLATFSVVVLYSESILLLYQASQHSSEDDDQTVLILLMSIFVTSQLLTNTASALLISLRMDFSGKPSGRLLCAFLHLGQQGIIWRLGKIVMFYDQRDWLEFVLLRMITTSVQTLPYLAIHGYLILTSSKELAMSLISLLVSLTSAGIGLTSFTIRNQVQAASWMSPIRQSVNSRKHCGYFLLLLGTSLGLASRLSAIILMSVEKLYWIAIPLGIHMAMFLFVSLLSKAWRHQLLSWKDIAKQVVFSYLNIFDLVDECFNRIQCKYVSYYTIILIENIIMTAVWMVSSDMEYTIKLVIILSILTCFICSLIFKFTACGLLFSSNSYVITLQEALDVKPEEYIDNISGQQLSNTSSTIREIADGIILRPTEDISFTEFDSNVSTSSITNKPWDIQHLQKVNSRQKQNDCGNNTGGETGKHKIINVASYFEELAAPPRSKTDSNNDKKHPVLTCYVLPQQNESIQSLANFDVHSSNSRNTNTLALSNVTSNNVSNEKMSKDSIIIKGKGFKFQQYPKAVLSLIKKHKLRKRNKKMRLFSPSDDAHFSCETASEPVGKERIRMKSSHEYTCKNYETEFEEFNWVEDITSDSSSNSKSDRSDQACSRTDSFITELSSTSMSTWPSLEFGYFNPNILPKENPNSTENITHWLNDVQRHTQEMTEGHHFMKGQHSAECQQHVTEGQTHMSGGQEHVIEGHKNMTGSQEHSTEDQKHIIGGQHIIEDVKHVTEQHTNLKEGNKDIFDGCGDISTDEPSMTEGQHRTRRDPYISKYYTLDQSYPVKFEGNINQHSNKDNHYPSLYVFGQCMLNSNIDDDVHNSEVESWSKLSALSKSHVNVSKPREVPSSDGQLQVSSSQENVKGTKSNSSERNSHRYIKRKFSLDNKDKKFTEAENEQTSCDEQLSNHDVPFCVKLGDMESLV